MNIDILPIVLPFYLIAVGLWWIGCAAMKIAEAIENKNDKN